MGAVDPATHHWFMGDGMIHGIRLREGRAEWYRNRYVGSTNVQNLRGEPDIPGPNWNGSTHGPNTNVGGFAGTTWAMVEAGGCPVELTYELDTVGRNDFFGTLPGAFTAHPKVDPDTGEMHAMVYAWGQWLDHIQYVVVGPDGRVNRTVDIPLGMTMLHDMSLTGRYAVVYDQPVTVDIDLAFAGRFPFRWTPDYGNRIGLLPRDGQADDIIWIDMPLGYAFHPLNSYDTPDGKVVIDICNYPKMFDADILGPFGDRALAKLERWELDPLARTVSITVIDDAANEFPRHRGSLTAKPYRYGYCAVPTLDQSAGWPTVKHDLQTGERHVFDHGPGRAAGEPVFVARPDGTDEDDGWLVTYVHDLGAGSAEFVVLDAADFDRGYVAQVPLPQRIPYGFHGNWVSDRSVPEPV
jgi:carotenoid cleavage dioxygenase